MPFQFRKLEIPGPVLIEPRSFPDDRGYFMETYARSAFLAAGIDCEFYQDNFSVSKKNVMRGLHFQKAPKEQGKLVQVVQGRVFDVVVDIRPGSETFGRWLGVELSAENRNIFWIPPGFAHGFLSLADNSIFLYKVTQEYSPNDDAGIRFDDSEIGVVWPIERDTMIISNKDKALPPLRDIG